MNRKSALCIVNMHMCVQTKTITTELKVWVWQAEAPGNQFIAMQRRRRVTIVVFFQKVAGFYRQSCPLECTQPAVALKAFVSTIHS